jgi:LysM repeat protein
MKTSSLPIFFTIAAAHVVGLGLLYVATSGDSKPKHADVASNPSKTEMSSKAVEPVKSSGSENKLVNNNPVPPAGQFEIYKVKAGDNLSKIAKDRKMSVAALAKANKLSTTASLKLNQQLVIPMN